jgi:O-acetyl-ADP-ribose deacetylase (regulator of RNase III)
MYDTRKYIEKRVQSWAVGTMHSFAVAGRTIEITRGNIVDESADAIVNAANSSLLGGGGVDGAIHRAGGPTILEACRAIRSERGPLPAGGCVATTAGQLQARYVIHTVGPIYREGSSGEPETLARCYRGAIQLADSLGLVSVAFPSISTGAFGYPVGPAARVAVHSVREGLQAAVSVARARFVLFDGHSLDAYVAAAKEFDSGAT